MAGLAGRGVLDLPFRAGHTEVVLAHPPSARIIGVEAVRRLQAAKERPEAFAEVAKEDLLAELKQSAVGDKQPDSHSSHH